MNDYHVHYADHCRWHISIMVDDATMEGLSDSCYFLLVIRSTVYNALVVCNIEGAISWLWNFHSKSNYNLKFILTAMRTETYMLGLTLVVPFTVQIKTCQRKARSWEIGKSLLTPPSIRLMWQCEANGTDKQWILQSSSHTNAHRTVYCKVLAHHVTDVAPPRYCSYNKF